MAGGKVIERDKGFNRIRETFAKQPDVVVKVGIQGAEAKENHTGDFGAGRRPLTNIEVGVIHEFGAPGASIPERSFIRAPAKANSKKYAETMKKVVKGALAGLIDVGQGLELLGIQVEADMKSAMDKGISPPLKRRRAVPAGVKPGKQVPLINTAQLRNSITHVVTTKT